MEAAIAPQPSTLGVNQTYAPLGDLAQELRQRNMEETFEEHSFYGRD